MTHQNVTSASGSHSGPSRPPICSSPDAESAPQQEGRRPPPAHHLQDRPGLQETQLSSAGVSGVANMTRTDPRVVVHFDRLDAQPWELNTPAGVVNLGTGTITPPDPAKLHTRSTAVARTSRPKPPVGTSSSPTPSAETRISSPKCSDS
ncbi:hypothetical protein [Aestuariimicrobium sp. Y1814]|uniref:hypothetical protein n=1 Tax=Aestuariimicrobium sp. Y1814 TaxID=3418742 RepID=UPI003DA79AB3